MAYTGYTTEEVGRRGQEFYDRVLRAQVEPSHAGEFLILDIVSGSYAIALDDLTASEHLLAQHPNAVLYGVRIGATAAYRLGGKTLGDSPC